MKSIVGDGWRCYRRKHDPPGHRVSSMAHTRGGGSWRPWPAPPCVDRLVGLDHLFLRLNCNLTKMATFSTTAMPNEITKKKVCEIIPKTMPLMVKSRITQRITMPPVVTRAGHWRPEEVIVQP